MQPTPNGLVPARPRPLDPADTATTIRNLNRFIDELMSLIADKNVRIHRLTSAAYQIDVHRESIVEMAQNLRIIPRWHWIRRNRIRRQLAQLAITIERRTHRG